MLQRGADVSDLYDHAAEPDRQRLLAAGWTPLDYHGQTLWRSPDRKTHLSEDEALKRLDGEKK